MDVKYNEVSFRNGKEILEIVSPDIHQEVGSIIEDLEPYPHGTKKGTTARQYLLAAFENKGWTKNAPMELGTKREDSLALAKWNVGMELEFSKFEMFFRDFFRFMILYERKQIAVGIIITLDQMAYDRWPGQTEEYGSARASLQKLDDILSGNYASLVKVPLWSIGIE